MKIIGTDNHARETVSETVAAENIPNEHIAKIMCDALNAPLLKSGNPNGPGTWYVVMPDDYQPYKYEV